MKVTRSFLFKLDAYLRSPGVFVGSKLHFWACICLSFFLCNYWFILWLFFLSVCQRCSFLTYVCRAENGICLCGVKTLSWRRVGEGGAIYIYIYIFGYCFNTYYWTLLSFFFFFFWILNWLTFLLRLYVFIKAMFSFIFTSLTAVHMYDFNIIKKNIKRKVRKRKNKEKEVLVISLYKFLGFWSYLLGYDSIV